LVVLSKLVSFRALSVKIWQLVLLSLALELDCWDLIEFSIEAFVLLWLFVENELLVNKLFIISKLIISWIVLRRCKCFLTNDVPLLISLGFGWAVVGVVSDVKELISFWADKSRLDPLESTKFAYFEKKTIT